MKTVNLSEEAYNKLKERLVNEISYGMVDRAYDRSDKLFYDVRTSFEDFYNTLNDAIFNAKHESGEGEQTSNPYLEKIKGIADVIYDILNQKHSQQNKFYDETSKVDHNKFYDSDDAENNDIDNMDLKYLQDKYQKS